MNCRAHIDGLGDGAALKHLRRHVLRRPRRRVLGADEGPVGMLDQDEARSCWHQSRDTAPVRLCIPPADVAPARPETAATTAATVALCLAVPDAPPRSPVLEAGDAEVAHLCAPLSVQQHCAGGRKLP